MNEQTPFIKEQDKIIACVDIGTTKVCAVVARYFENGKLEILGVGKAESHGVNRGVVANIDKTVEAIKNAVDEASRRSSIKIHNVYVGIAGQHIKSAQQHGYRMRNNPEQEITGIDIKYLIEDMHRTMVPADETIIHVLPQEFTIDGEKGIKEPIGMCGTKLEADFHIVTGLKSSVQNIKRCIEKAGLKMVGLILEPLASASAVLTLEEKEAGVALIDIGGGTTDLAVYKDSIIRHTAVIPLGGNIITEDIKDGCMVLHDQAERLKTNFGTALASDDQDNTIISINSLRGREPREISLKNLAHIIESRMSEIAEFAYNEIEITGLSKKLIAGIVLAGGGARLKYLRQLVEYITGTPTRIGYPTEHLTNKRLGELQDPMYATAIGILLKASENNDAILTELYVQKEEPLFNTYQANQKPIHQQDEQSQYQNTSGTLVNNTAINEELDFNDIPNNQELDEQPKKTISYFINKAISWLEGDVKDFKN